MRAPRQTCPNERPAPAVTLQWAGKPDLLPPAPIPLDVGDAEHWRPPLDGQPLGPESDEPPSPDWTNMLIHADAVATLDGTRTPDWHDRIQRAGGIKLIYLDPPFATGQSFTAERRIGRDQAEGEPIAVAVPAYRDIWDGGRPAYLTFLSELLNRALELLASDGWLCVHVDHRASAYLRVLLDEICGADAFVNEIIWSYGLGNNRSSRGFARKHDTLLLYAKTPEAPFFPLRGEVTSAMRNKYRHVRPDGTRFMRSYGREYDLKGGKPLGSVWEIPSLAPTSRERRGYPTQKPEALLERLILATTRPGDLVLDPCAGSGTSLAVAEKLGRRWIGGDQSAVALSVMRERLLAVGARFDVLTSRELALHSNARNQALGITPSVIRDGATMTVVLDEAGRSPTDSAALWSIPPVGPQLRRAGPGREQAIAGWDAITGWAVALMDTSGGDPPVFSPTWAAFRTAPGYRLPHRSAPIRLPDRGIRAIRLRSFFLDGTIMEHVLDLS